MPRPTEIAEKILAEASLPKSPRRIVCLTEETVEILYKIGAGDLVVGVSKYVERPPEAKLKPRVSAFVKADFAAIEAVSPDLVLCFSDLQADIAAECARRGLSVVVFNQRSVGEILGVVLAVGAMVGREVEGKALVQELMANLRDVAGAAARLPKSPRVHFEEWDDPLITGIRWVAELVAIAGGQYVFPKQSMAQAAKDRIVDPTEVVAADPEVILASWCGKDVRIEAIRNRPGWDAIAAVKNGRIHEIPSTLILQPGPAALTDGLVEMHRHIAAAARGTPPKA